MVNLRRKQKSSTLYYIVLAIALLIVGGLFYRSLYTAINIIGGKYNPSGDTVYVHVVSDEKPTLFYGARTYTNVFGINELVYELPKGTVISYRCHNLKTGTFTVSGAVKQVTLFGKVAYINYQEVELC